MKILKIVVLSFLFLFILPAQFTIAKMSPERTAEYMKKSMDYNDSIVVAKANSIKNKYPDNYFGQVCASFDLLFLSWKYRPDPNGKEKFYKASISLKTFTGDCDDYAIAMASLITALGGKARVVCIIDHAYPEVCLGKNPSQSYLDSLPILINKHYYEVTGYDKYMTTVHYHIDDDGSVWMNLDWWEYYPGSKFHNTDPAAEHLLIYADGSYEIAYSNKPGHIFPPAN